MSQTPKTVDSQDAGSVTLPIPRAQQGHGDAMNELPHRLGTDFAARLFAGLNTLQQADREIVAARTRLRMFAMLKEGHSPAAIQRDVPLTRAKDGRLIDLLVSLAREDGQS